MNLEELNQQYLMLKGNLTTMRANLKAAEQEVTQLISDKRIKEGELEAAKRAGDKDKQQECSKKIQQIDAAIKKEQAKAETLKGNMKYLKEQIDEKVNAVKAMPEVKKDLDIAIRKNAERQAVKKQKEIKDLEDKDKKLDEQKAKLEALQELAKGDHTSNFMRGMVAANQELIALGNELNSLKQPSANGLITYSDPKRASEIMNKLIPEAKKKMDANKKPLLAVIEKRKLKLTEKDLQDMLLDKAVLGKDGKVDLNQTFKKQVVDVDKQKQAITKQLEKNKKQLHKFNVAHDIAETSLSHQTSLAPTDKPKWWNLVARFKNWNENRKLKKAEREREELREAGYDVDEPQPAEGNNSERESNSREDFTHTLKYEIVRDTMKNVMKEYSKQQEQQQEQPTQQQEDEGR